MIKIAEIGIILFIVLPSLFFDWHARFVFVAIAYPRRYGHGKSFNRAKKHYKQNWTFLQRMLWMPVFREEYHIKYRMMAYLSYINFILMIISIFCFIINVFLYTTFIFWHWVFILTGAFGIIRFIYNNDYIARRQRRGE